MVYSDKTLHSLILQQMKMRLKLVDITIPVHHLYTKDTRSGAPVIYITNKN